ncbi:MAG: hypothetical protein QME65_03665 [Candidatus Omnitrophota bacterium]|nr:hypothetical protein [Candidatus Omnitrophota bacterium]
MKRIVLVLFCFLIAGCSYFRQGKTLKVQTAQLEEALTEKEEQLKQLQGLLNEKEDLIKENELKIKELRKKLASLGVF